MKRSETTGNGHYTFPIASDSTGVVQGIPWFPPAVPQFHRRFLLIMFSPTTCRPFAHAHGLLVCLPVCVLVCCSDLTGTVGVSLDVIPLCCAQI